MLLYFSFACATACARLYRRLGPLAVLDFKDAASDGKGRFTGL